MSRCLPWLILLAMLTACSSVSKVLPDKRIDYKRQRVAESDLEVPPDLTRGTIGDAMPIPGTARGATATYSKYREETTGERAVAVSGSEVLPEVPHVRMLRDGNQRWLEIDQPPQAVWPKLVSFWRRMGVVLVEQNPALGVMKTDWLENRADIPSGMLTDLFRKVLEGLHSAATRDQFRVRLERGDAPGTTYLYLTHRGMQEELSKDVSGDTENTVWVPRPSDPGLEAEMLRRIMLYLGLTEAQSKQLMAQAEERKALQSELLKTRSGVALEVQADRDRAWRLVGIALERAGFEVQDRDRDQGVYFVKYDDPMKEKDQGFFSKLAFWREDKIDSEAEYRIHLSPDGEERTRVTVEDAQGRADHSDTAERILTLVHEHID